MSSDRVGTGRGPHRSWRPGGFVLLWLVAALVPGGRARADGPFWRRGTTVVPSSRSIPAPRTQTVNSFGRLGTFYPTPYLMVRGNAPAGGGYSPLGEYGNTTLSLYGPLSSFRMT